MRDRDFPARTGRPRAGDRGLLERLRRVFGQASWTIIDQALLSLSSFVTNLVLARWLAPTEFGGYMAASALFWVGLSVYGGSLTDPMMVFGSARFRDRLSAYFAVLADLHWCISAAISAGLAAAGLALVFWGSRATALGMLGYALAAPATLLLSLLRRTAYLRSRPWLAAGAGGLYLAAILATLYIVYRTASLSSFTAPLCAAVASCFAIPMIFAMQPFRLWSSWRHGFTREIVTAHWRYGRWAVLSGIVSWAVSWSPGGLYYLLIVPLLAGLQANAALIALWNLVMPAIQLNLALGLLLVPTFGRMRRDRRAESVMWIVLCVQVAAALLYALIIALFGGPLIDLIYRGRYTQYGHLAWLVGLAALPTAAVAVVESVLRACERPDRVLWAYVAAGAVTCSFGVAAVAAWGLVGAIIGLLASCVTVMLVESWWVLGIDTWARTPAMHRKPRAHLAIPGIRSDVVGEDDGSADGSQADRGSVWSVSYSPQASGGSQEIRMTRDETEGDQSTDRPS